MKIKKKEGSGFKYRKRSSEKWKKRQSQKGGMYDNTVKDEFPIFTLKDGSASIRILPPTFDDAEHYGLDVFQHFGVGPDEQSYLCLDKMGRGKCPMCEEGRRLQRKGDTDGAKELKPSKRCAVWIIDKKKPADGPKVYVMPWTLDRDIAAVCVDDDSGEVLAIDDPDEGFDVKFRREGSGRNTNYLGIKIAQRPSPISDSPRQKRKWLEYITEHPLPEVLNFYDYDYIKGVFNGTPSKEDGEDEEETGFRHSKKKTLKKRSRDEDEKPRKFKKKKKFREDPLDDDEDEKPRKFKKKGLKSKIGKKIRKGLRDRAA